MKRPPLPTRESWSEDLVWALLGAVSAAALVSLAIVVLAYWSPVR